MISCNSINDNLNQPQRRRESITIGRMAPDFYALSTQGYIRLSDYKGKWVVLASHPQAFGAVSTTEIIDTALLYPELQKRNTEFLGLTTDNVYANLAWVYDIYQKTGITIPFPIISDSYLQISEQYGMLNPDRLFEESVRDSFIINPYGRISAILTLPVATGRNRQELLRVLDSLQIHEQYNLNTPADWRQGGQVIVPNPTSYEELINRVNTGESLGYQCPFWYVCYTDLNTYTDINNDVQNEDSTS